MRHRKDIRKFGRNTSSRKALLRGMAVSFIRYRQIATTEAKAKELRRVVERLITLGKSEHLANYRRIASYLNDPQAAKLVREIAASFKERPGGYIQIIKTDTRRGDRASMVLMKLL